MHSRAAAISDSALLLA